MDKYKSNKKDSMLPPEEGRRLCEEARKSVEYGMKRFPEVDEANRRRENDRFHQWVKARNNEN